MELEGRGEVKLFSGEVERIVGDGMGTKFWLDRWRPGFSSGSLPSYVRHFKSKRENGKGDLEFDGYEREVGAFLV